MRITEPSLSLARGPALTAVTLILPARNEGTSLAGLLPALRESYPELQILVVDDGSVDDTRAQCQLHNVKVVRRPYAMGNGAAIKAGAREAESEVLIFMDADGQHRPADVVQLLARLNEGYDMVVGARGTEGQAGRRRTVGNYFYNRFASLITGHKIEDLTSGFRAVRADKFREFLHLLPNGFSYPTTITMAFLRSGYSVAYVPIEVNDRIGTSHLKLVRDGVRLLLIIFKIGTMYAPLKIFAPASALFFLLGVINYAHSYFTDGRFTNMATLLFVTAIITFLIGLLSEQITSLLYQRSGSR
ncbi:MAG: glycosyltransferase family 2 protein [Gammaproteobacteria bacterium]